MQILSRNEKTALQPLRGLRVQVDDELIAKLLKHALDAPNQVAVMTEDSSLTYNQLCDEVLRWRQLLSQTVQGRVVVCLERSSHLLPVLLALQWLEVTYIPVDPAVPIMRLCAIIEDSQAQAFLYDKPHHADYSVLPCPQMALADMELPEIDSDEITHYQLPKPQTIAYILYTSGSTGTPKGVAISRHALNNFLASMGRYFLHDEQEVLLAITTITFDIAILELFLPIWQRKTVYIVPDEQHKDPFAISKLLTDYPITLMQATPAMWKMLESVGWKGKPDLVALCGGEALTHTLTQYLTTAVKSLWNMYGPTEATVWCALKQIRAHEPITIGRPIDNMEMCVMDATHTLLPPFVKGELYIGGLGLAQGYVNNDALTQERFITWDGALGGRLYRVGDVACTTPDGEFIIFGRVDNQHKLRGYRIELEDIEAHLQRRDCVRECAVIIYQEQLIAYLSLTDSELFSEAVMIEQLSQDLPDYMLPKRFVILNQLPQTTSGKIDRNALPLPERVLAQDTHDLTPLQATLIRIWSEELAVPSLIGLQDNFFALGGHSLLAARIIARIQKEIGKQISLKHFYQSPTIAQLADVVTNAQSSNATGRTMTSRDSHTKWLALNDFQLMLWIATVFEPKVKQINTVGYKRIQGPIDINALNLALQLVYQKQDIFSYKILRSYPLQKKHNGPPPQWKEESLENREELACKARIRASFDELCYFEWRNKALLLQTRLFYLPNNQVELQICMGHLISDESSIAIFFHELSNAYLFYTNHTPLRAKESYWPVKNYLLAEQGNIRKNLTRDEQFWKTYLHDTGLLPLARQHPLRRDKQTHFSTYLEVPDVLLDKLRKFCIKHHLTPNDTLCAAVAFAIMACFEQASTWQHNLVINIIKSTRNEAQYDNVIGCFLRLYLIKLQLKAGSSLISLANQVQRSTLETEEYQGAPSLVKLACVGQAKKIKNRFLLWILSQAASVIAKLFSRMPIHAAALKACVVLGSMQRDNDLLVNVNIGSDFLTDALKNPNECLLGKPVLDVPLYQYDLSNIENVFNVFFIRDSSQRKSFLVISADIMPSFRERFARTILEIIQQQAVE